MRKGWRGQCRLVCAGEAEALDVRGVVEGFANLGFLVAIRVGGECCAGGGVDQTLSVDTSCQTVDNQPIGDANPRE